MFELRSYLPYLLNRVGFAVTDLFAAALAEDEVTVPMWRVLAVLWHDGTHRIGDLADLTSIEISTLSRLIGSLQRRGLVVRKRTPSDARVVQVALTDRGRALTEKLVPAAAALEERLIGALTATEVAALKALLDKLFANVQARAGAPDVRSA